MWLSEQRVRDWKAGARAPNPRSPFVIALSGTLSLLPTRQPARLLGSLPSETCWPDPQVWGASVALGSSLRMAHRFPYLGQKGYKHLRRGCAHGRAC